MNEFIESLASKINWKLMKKEYPDLYDDPVVKHLRDITIKKARELTEEEGTKYRKKILYAMNLEIYEDGEPKHE